jgi:hypothetical protein
MCVHCVKCTEKLCFPCVLLLLRVVNLYLLLYIEVYSMLPFLHYCCVCVCVCVCDIDDDAAAVVTKHFIFFEGHLCLCVCLLPYTQTITLNKDKTLLVPPQMEHLVYWIGCGMNERGILSLILGKRFYSWNHLHSVWTHPPSCSVGSGDIFHRGKVARA